MDTKRVLHQIVSLSRLEIDSIHCYNQALPEIGDSCIKRQLENFRQDHRDHLEDFSSLSFELGGVSQNYSHEFRHFWHKSFITVGRGVGKIGALKTLLSNANIMSKYYESIVVLSFSSDMRAQLEDKFEDEQDHIIYMEEILSLRSMVCI